MNKTATNLKQAVNDIKDGSKMRSNSSYSFEGDEDKVKSTNDAKSQRSKMRANDDQDINPIVTEANQLASKGQDSVYSMPKTQDDVGGDDDYDEDEDYSAMKSKSSKVKPSKK